MRGKGITKWVGVVLAAGLFGGCTALDQDARLNFLEGQMKDMLQKSAEWDVSSKDVRTKIADFGAQMDSMRDDLQRLSGNIEEIQAGSRPRENPLFSQSGMTEEIRSLKERLLSLEEKVSELEKGLATGRPLSDTLVPPGGSIAVPGAPPRPAAADTSSSKPPAAAQKTGALPEDRRAYDEAMEAMKQKQYEKAIRLFRGFIRKYPGNDLSDNAQYWVGESYYAQKKYEEAIIEFEEVVQQYPKGDKVPAALLKEGLAFHELKDDTPARQILKKLIDQHPDSEEAKLAAKKLKEI